MPKNTAYTFIPALGMHNRHVQTIFGRVLCLFWEKHDLKFEKEILNLSQDGSDFLELVWHPQKQDKNNTPIVILFPGLGGNLKQGPQYKQLLERISMAGWRALFVHFRGCGELENHTSQTYHSVDTLEIDAVMNYLKELEPKTPLAAIGISSGGGLLAKWLENPENKGKLITSIIISPAFDIGAVSKQNQWYMKFYLFYFLNAYRDSLVKKFSQLRDARVNIEELKKAQSMYELDQALSKIYGYSSAQAYYEAAKIQFDKIESSLTIIHDANDPLVPTNSIPKETIAKNPHITYIETTTGGHGGFIGKGTIFSPFRFWLGDVTIDLLQKEKELVYKPLTSRKQITNCSKSFFWKQAKNDVHKIACTTVLFGLAYRSYDDEKYTKIFFYTTLLWGLKITSHLIDSLYGFLTGEDDSVKSSVKPKTI